VTPKPVKVTFGSPFTNLVASADIASATGDGGRRNTYLRFAGLAFALLALAGLSLHVVSARLIHARAE
jgi:hypothetical protein